MNDSIGPHSTMVGTSTSDSFMDFDYMDELLLEGCWLEANGSEFQNFDSSSTPFSPFEPSFVWPTLEHNNPSNQQSSFPENPPISQSHLQNIQDEQSKRWWIGPKASISVMDRLRQAIGHIKDCSRDNNVLIQVWVPVQSGGKRVLTTSEQPVSLDLNCPSLAQYREISEKYQFPAEEDCEEAMGMPGRVFRSKVPEWTPDVRFFTRDEYPRVGHAKEHDVRGTLAVPVLEHGSHACLGVIEVVLTTQKSNYRPELESVCKALQAVDLRSSEESSTQNVKTSDLSYQAALPEIQEVLRCACMTHGLPLAQTWVSCILQGKDGCRHSEDNLKNCVSPVDSACYIGDLGIKGFHEACCEYHLLKDQGIVGRAFRTNQPCFSPEVTACSKADYPLSHHARMFGLKAAVAIRLRSISTGSADFVLEFFLPIKCSDPEEQKKLLSSLSDIIQNVYRTLRVVTDKELELESKALSDKVVVSKEDQISLVQKGKRSRETLLASFSQDTQLDSNSRQGITFVTNPSTSGDYSSLLYTNKTGEKRRVKAEKAITLPVLRQHFSGSLKDAARNLGVCPTTLKRICRHHGIQRWPSRKIKKVGHSLQKIQRVIDSVQGASGVLQIESFYSNFPELASPKASRISNSIKPPPSASVSPSSSCSHSSSSSQCCSSGTKHPNSYTSAPPPAHEDPTVKEESVERRTLERSRSDANLKLCSGNGPKVLPRSQSYVSFREEEVAPVNNNIPVAVEKSRDGPRIKVTFGEDAIRFRMQNRWRYKDLLDEISRRFGIVDCSGFHLKYLDDDAEWVLLTCDADLEECIDVCGSSQNQTIKLSISRESRSQFGR